MRAFTRLFIGPLMCVAVVPSATFGFESDVIATAAGDLRLTFIGHGTLMFEFNKTVIHVDPVSRYADYSTLPKANMILVTHEHGDHLDKGAIDKVSTDDTVLLLTKTCAQRIKTGIVMENGDTRDVEGLRIEAVPAYNIVHMRGPGRPYHPKGVGNGYVITFGQTRVYVAGDTENIPEMKDLKDIDCAFLPMNLPYTMTPEMVAEVAKTIKPRILYPYHFGNTDTSRLVTLLKNEDDIEVRIRKLQ